MITIEGEATFKANSATTKEVPSGDEALDKQGYQQPVNLQDWSFIIHSTSLWHVKVTNVAVYSSCLF